MEHFTAIRNGIVDHIEEGKLCPFDLGIYVFMHLRADWATGIYHGCALTIAHQFSDSSLKHHINKTLIRLRERQYINYRKGDGRRGAYPILINKYHVTVGELSGHRLNAWKNGCLATPEYEAWNGRGRVEEESRNGGGTVEEPYLDIKTLLDVKDKPLPRKKSAEPEPILYRIYNAYPRKVARAKALLAISKAIMRIQEQENCSPKDAADFIYAAVVKFGESPAGNRGNFTPHCSTWMNEERFFDDPTEWWKADAEANCNRPVKLPPTYVPASEQRRKEMEQRRAALAGAQ